jgi:hypothetical protein
MRSRAPEKQIWAHARCVTNHHKKGSTLILYKPQAIHTNYSGATSNRCTCAHTRRGTTQGKPLHNSKELHKGPGAAIGYLGTEYPKKAPRPPKSGPPAKQFSRKAQKTTRGRPTKLIDPSNTYPRSDPARRSCRPTCPPSNQARQGCQPISPSSNPAR